MKKSLFLFVGVFLVFCVSSIYAQEKPQTVNAGVINGKAVSLVKPVYPPAARAVRASGTVNIEVIVDEAGKVISATALSGHPLLREEATKAAMESKFSPTKLGGKAVKIKGVIVYNFIPQSEKSNDKTLDGVLSELITDKDSKGEVVNGKALSIPKPEYPSAAKAVKAEGAVKVQVTIDEDGNVISAKAISGHELLRESSETAAMQAKFEPTKINNQPVKVTGVLVYNFVAADDKKTEQLNDKTVNGAVLNGKAISLIKPLYPEDARKEKAEGSVNVKVTIDEDGNVISAKAVSGHPLLRESAEKAALESKFTPTTLSGNPVKVTGIIIYNFTAAKK